MLLIKTENAVSVAGGVMGTPCRKYVSGIIEFFEYNNDVVIRKYIPRKDLKQNHEIQYFAIIENFCFFNCQNELDINNLEIEYSKIFHKKIEQIKLIDLTVAKRIVDENSKLFNLLKEEPFNVIIKDYLNKSIFTKDVIAGLMIERGHEFTSLNQLSQL